MMMARPCLVDYADEEDFADQNDQNDQNDVQVVEVAPTYNLVCNTGGKPRFPFTSISEH